MTPVYARRTVEVAIYSVMLGSHTSTYTRVPEGTPFYWAMRLNGREPQLWATDGHGWPGLAVVGSAQRDYYFTTTNPRERFYPPKGALP